jgi:rare lipoprotein A
MLPFGTVLEITNLNNGRRCRVKVNDRGPFKGKRILDLSLGAAQELEMVRDGIVPVEVEIISVGGQ